MAIETAFYFLIQPEKNIRIFGKVAGMKLRNKIFHPFPHFYYVSVILYLKKIFHNIGNKWGEKRSRN